MVREHDSAPDFTLPGVSDNTVDTFQLATETDRGQNVLLLFFPFDFSPVCTNELCAIRDAEWFQLTPDLTVWAISSDSVFAHRAFADEYRLDFPLLSDSAGRIAEEYDVCYDEWEGHVSVPKRAVFLIDSDQTVRYRWHTDDALNKPDFFPVKKALDTLEDEQDTPGPDAMSLEVDYEAGPGQISR